MMSLNLILILVTLLPGYLFKQSLYIPTKIRLAEPATMKFIVENTERRGKSAKQLSSAKKSDPIYYYYNITNPSNKIQCDICKRDITKYTKILANQSDYCVHCFSNLQTIPDNYHIINKLDYPLFDAEWTAEEELLLFEGLEKHGFGNWSQIADFIGTGKAREDVESHYTQNYLEVDGFIPNKELLSRRDPKTNKLVKKVVQPLQKRASKSTKKITYQNKHQHQRGTLTVNSQPNPSLKSNANAAQIVGYMPKRGDFQVQYDNDAELLLAEMEFNEDDTEEEKQMKFKLMDIYNQKLTERIRRKQFVITRKLLDLKEQSRLEKNRTKEEKEVHSMMKVFSRFHSAEEHQKLVQGIIRQRQIRQRIQELKEYRKKGFRTLAEIEEQLEHKRKKDQRAKSKKHEQSSVYFTGSYQTNKTRRPRKDAPVQRNDKRTPYLNQEESQLCQRLNIHSKQYMVIKETILRQSVKMGILQKDQVSKLFKTDRGLVDGIFDFLVQREDVIAK